MFEISIIQLITLTGFAVGVGIFLSSLIDDYEKNKPVNLKYVIWFTICTVIVITNLIFTVI